MKKSTLKLLILTLLLISSSFASEYKVVEKLVPNIQVTYQAHNTQPEWMLYSSGEYGTSSQASTFIVYKVGDEICRKKFNYRTSASSIINPEECVSIPSYAYGQTYTQDDVIFYYNKGSLMNELIFLHENSIYYKAETDGWLFNSSTLTGFISTPYSSLPNYEEGQKVSLINNQNLFAFWYGKEIHLRNRVSSGFNQQQSITMGWEIERLFTSISKYLALKTTDRMRNKYWVG